MAISSDPPLPPAALREALQALPGWGMGGSRRRLSWQQALPSERAAAEAAMAILLLGMIAPPVPELQLFGRTLRLTLRAPHGEAVGAGVIAQAQRIHRLLSGGQAR